MTKFNLNQKGDEAADIIDAKVCHAVQVRLKYAHKKIFNREKFYAENFQSRAAEKV